MLPMSSSNHHTHIESNWKTYYDAKKILRQTEQRLKDARDYYPHVHLNNHHDNADLSTSSSFLLHGDTSSSIHAANRTLLNDDRAINNKHQLLDSEALQTIRRKISKQKIAAERRAEQLFHSQSDAGHMFESYRPHSTYSTSASLQNLHYSPYRQQRLSPPKPQPSYASHICQSQSFPSELDTVLRTSTTSKVVPKETDIIRTNDFERSSFHPRKMTKVLPKDNYSLPSGRSTIVQPRSASATASTSLASKYQDLHSSHFLTSTDPQRLKHVRRVESAHASGAKTSLITSDAWQTDPIINKKTFSLSQQEKSSKKKTASEIISKRTKTDIEESLATTNQRTDKMLKPKRDTSASKTSPIIAEKTPLKSSLVKPKSDDENKKFEDLIQQKRQQHEEILSNEKRPKDEPDKLRKDKLKKFNEQNKDTTHSYLQTSSITKRTSAFTPVTPKDLTEQTRQRLLRLLGPTTDYHAASSYEPSSLFDRCSSTSSTGSSSSSLSSSNDSVIEVQSMKPSDPSKERSRSEPPMENGSSSNGVQRHENLLRWAVNLTRDCDLVENRFKYLRSNGIQSYDTIPSSYQHLQNDDGNLRYQSPHYEINNIETIKSSTYTRFSERLNSNHVDEYPTSSLTNAIDNRDLLSERLIYRDRAAAKIQAAYRGYSVRKSLLELNEKPKYLDDDFNRRPIQRREPSTTVNIEIRSSKDSFPIDSALLRYHENLTNNDYPQQPIRKITTLPFYSDDYDNLPSAPISNLSTPINHKQIPIINTNLSSDVPNGNNQSTLATPIPSPETYVPLSKDRRRSMSPPLPPQMSPDNGRPLPCLHQPTSQQSNEEQNEPTKQSRSNSRSQNSPVNTLPQQQIRKSPVQQSSLSSSSSSSSSTVTNRKRRSPSPQQQTINNAHSRHRTSQNSSPPTSSSESILTAREKRIRQKFNSDVELQAYEKRLKDIEKKIRQLVKRAFEIFDEKRSISSPPTVARTTKNDPITHNRSKSTNHFQDDSSISEETSTSRKDSESIKKDNEVSSNSTQPRQSDVLTSDASDLESRVRAYREQLKAKKLELERLKQRKNKEILRRQEDELKKQIESCDHEIQTLRLQPVQQEQTVPVPTSNNRSTSPVAEDRKSDVPNADKRVHSPKPNIFGNYGEKQIDERPLETPRDERDTQHDAQSISITTDQPMEYETDYDSRRASLDNEKSVNNSNINTTVPSQERKDSTSSSSISSEKVNKSLSPQVSNSLSPPPPSAQDPIKSPSSLVQQRVQTLAQEQGFIPINEPTYPQPSSIHKDYDNDFSDYSRSPRLSPIKLENKNDNNNTESIQEDIESKPSACDVNQSITSKSSAEEQSEILVIGKKSSNLTPKQQIEKPFEDKIPLNPPKIEADDTSHDISEDDEGNKRVEQDNKIDKLTEQIARTFIDEAIEQGQKIGNLITEDVSDENNKQTSTNPDEVDDDALTPSKEPEVPDKSDTTNSTNEEEELKIDLTGFEENSSDESREGKQGKSSTNKEPTVDVVNNETSINGTEHLTTPVIEGPIKPVVSHSSEKVIRLCHEALTILYDQNTDFSDRSNINRTIPDSYFNHDQQDVDDEDIRRSRHAYHRMIFDLCVELLHEMYSSNVRITKYPEWQKTKLIPKRFYRLNKPNNRDEAESFVQRKVLEILNLMPRQITYSKWRISLGRRHDTEQFENVLDEELRRTESQWIDYEDDSLRIKFDIAEHIFDQLMQETLTECFHVINKRLLLSSNSTGV